MTFAQYLKAKKLTVPEFVKQANSIRMRRVRPLGVVQFYRLLAGKDIHTSSLFRALEATRRDPILDTRTVIPVRRFVELRDVPVVRSAS